MSDPAPTLGSRFSARWRILGWLLLSAAAGLAAVVITVTSALNTIVARDANDDVEQELAEFRQFASEGIDPSTGAAFASADPLLEVFLRRQQLGPTEVLLGYSSATGALRQARGSAVDGPAHDLTRDRETLAAIEESLSGVTTTDAGELRWGKQEIVTSAGEEGYFFIGEYTQPGYDRVAGVTRLILWVSAGALVLSGVLGWLIAGQILAPIRVMRRTAAEISQEDLSRRIPVVGNDDLAELGNAFNSMLDRLESAFAVEQRFVDDAGHELRTPITIIRGHLELLSEDPEERRHTIALVTQELDRMSRIVTDLLALAKAERPDFVQIGGAVDIADLTLDIDSKVQALAPRNWVLARVADGGARVDAQRVTQAVLQLAENAVQHTSPGDTIRLASDFLLEDGELSVRFTVSDDGPGVAADDVATIFERFARGRSERPAGTPSGAGLGLAIVRAIADGHGGAAFVDSVPGEGATFGLILPARVALPEVPPPPVLAETVGENR